MAGLIRKEDIAKVREATAIEDIVNDYVTLRPAGTGSMKGLCPFHDEKTPSFHVRPPTWDWGTVSAAARAVTPSRSYKKLTI